MYDLVLKEGMWHEIAFSEGKRRRSLTGRFFTASATWEAQKVLPSHTGSQTLVT